MQAKKYTINCTAAAFITTSIFLLFVIGATYLLIQKGTLTNLVKKYLQTLLKQQKNNSFLLLLVQQADSVISKEYLLSKAKILFISLGTISEFLIALVAIILAIKPMLNEEKKEIRENVKHSKITSQDVAFTILSVFATLLVISIPIVVLTQLMNISIYNMMNNYLNSIFPARQKNPFAEICKGIIALTFKSETATDPLTQLNNKIKVAFCIAIVISFLVILSIIAYLCCNNKMYNEEYNKNDSNSIDTRLQHNSNNQLAGGNNQAITSAA